MIWFFALLLFGATGRSSPPPAAPFAQVSKQAAAAREANRLDDAVRLYRESVRLRPNWTEGWWYLGTLLYDQDRYPEARSALRRFTALDPKAGPGWALLGLCEFETKEYRQAGEHLERARKLGIEANPQLTEVASFHEALLLTRFEKYEAALEILIDFARAGQDKPAMVEAAGIAALRKPMLPAELAEGDRELVMQVGRAVMDTGARRVAQAQKEFEEIIAHHPGEPQLLYLYGSFLLISDPEAGMRELKKAAELGVNWAIGSTDSQNGTIPIGTFNQAVGNSSIGSIAAAIQNPATLLSTGLPTGLTLGAGSFPDNGTNFAVLLRALRGDSATNILQTP